MLRVADSFAGTDTGRQRRHNEDSHLARSPLFVVADGMGGAQAGEVASSIAVQELARGLPDQGGDEERLAQRVRGANERIHDLSQSSVAHAGMGTTLTALYAGAEDVVVAHVGDSRAYCLRDGELERLTDDHSLVDELMRQGRLTPEEAEEHPQRSIITRALGPEPFVEIDTRTHRARAGDVYLICSDGLTSMIGEQQVGDILRANPDLRAAGEALLDAANAAGGRDNITVVLFRLEEVGAVAPVADDQPTTTGMPVAQPVRPRAPRQAPRRQAGPHRRSQRRRVLAGVAVVAVILAVIAAGLYIAISTVYFVGTDSRGMVAVYSGLPYDLPFGIRLYSRYYVSGVPASTIPAPRRHELLNHALRSQDDASSLVRQLELGKIAGAS